MNTFPSGMDDDLKRMENSHIASSLLFGNRFKADQTLYEYLVEFLLVFCSAKDNDGDSGRNEFHSILIERKLSYWVEPRMALRRFIFYDKSRKNGTIKADESAYQDMMNILLDKMDDIPEDSGREYLESLQDLFHGYAVVIKKRFWGAQALLPICPEFMLCGCDPSEKKRRKEVQYFEDNKISVDTKFSFDKRNFLARGGELYYLHLLQGLKHNPEKKELLEDLLKDLTVVQCRKISRMASYVQETWEKEMGFEKNDLKQLLNISYIPDSAYIGCEENSIDELINYLSCKMHPINRIDILAKGVMFQILRMMSYAVANYLKIEPKKWIVDMRGKASSDTVKKLSSESFRRVEDDFMTALNDIASSFHLPEEESMNVVRKAKTDSLDIFRAKGKELQCIVPVKGPFERFSLSEDVIRFLVLSLVAPQEKMTLNMFLEKLYRHYNIVIGPAEYKKMVGTDSDINESLTNSFIDNAAAFQSFLKATGFLRELSDATSIVVNPYLSIFKEEEA